MKVFFKLLLVSLLFISCASKSTFLKGEDGFSGVFLLKNNKKFQALSYEKNYSKISINENGTYKLYKAPVTFSPVVEQCEYASIGKWSIIDNNILTLISENYYLKQKGFKYEVKKENKFSNDSLYIEVVLPDDFDQGEMEFTFNNNKSIKTDQTKITLPKSKYLWKNKLSTNQIQLNIGVNVLGSTIYRSRTMFEIFDDSFDTEANNYLTISLPNFDRCFIEFEPYFKELIQIKDKNKLFWKGLEWKKE